MTIFRNTHEGGTNGVTISPGNSGGVSGDAFTSVEATCQYTNSGAAHGTISAQWTGSGSATGMEQYQFSDTPVKVAARHYIYLSAAPTATVAVLRYTRTGDAGGIRFDINPSQQLVIVGNDGANIWVGAAAIPTSTWVRLDTYGETGTNTTDGKVRAAWYVGDSTTAGDDSTLLTGKNTGGGQPYFKTWHGKVGTGSYTGTFRWDSIDVRTGTDATGLIGPPANNPPSVVAPAPQNVSTGATVTVPFSASDADGTIASRSTAFVFPTSGTPSITGGTTASPSFTASAEGLFILRQTVTDDQGATATADAEIRVLDADGTVTTIPDDGVGAWTNAGGAATKGQALSDGSNTTYLDSGTLTTTETEQRQRYYPRAAGTTYSPSWTLKADVGTPTVKLRLYEGTTLRQEWTQALTTSFATYTKTTTVSTAGWDSGNLWIAVAGNV